MWNVFGINRPTGKAIHYAIENMDKPYEGYSNFLEWLQETYHSKIERFYNILDKYSEHFNWEVIRPDGGFFTIVDISKSMHKVPVSYFYEGDEVSGKGLDSFEDWLKLDGAVRTPDAAFATWMTCEVGVTPLPCFSFYNQDMEGGIKGFKNVNFIRFAHCKDDETLDDLEVRLEKYYKKCKD